MDTKNTESDGPFSSVQQPDDVASYRQDSMVHSQKRGLRLDLVSVDLLPFANGRRIKCRIRSGLFDAFTSRCSNALCDVQTACICADAGAGTCVYTCVSVTVWVYHSCVFACLSVCTCARIWMGGHADITHCRWQTAFTRARAIRTAYVLGTNDEWRT